MFCKYYFVRIVLVNSDLNPVVNLLRAWMVSRGYFTKRAMIITERKETAAMYILTTSDKISFEITNNLFNMKSNE